LIRLECPLGSLADILRASRDVRFAPQADMPKTQSVQSSSVNVLNESRVRFDLKSGPLRRNQLGAKSGHGARVKGHVWLQAYAYLELASGSIPLFLIVSEARAEARNSTSRLEPSISLEPATTAAENV